MLRRIITATAVALGALVAFAGIAGASPETIGWRTTGDNGAIQVIRDGNHVWADKYAAGTGAYLGTKWGVWLRRECDTVELGPNGGGGTVARVSFFNTHYGDPIAPGESGVRGCQVYASQGTFYFGRVGVVQQFCTVPNCTAVTPTPDGGDGTFSFVGPGVTFSTECDWLDNCRVNGTRLYGYDYRASIYTW